MKQKQDGNRRGKHPDGRREADLKIRLTAADLRIREVQMFEIIRQQSATLAHVAGLRSAPMRDADDE